MKYASRVMLVLGTLAGLLSAAWAIDEWFAPKILPKFSQFITYYPWVAWLSLAVFLIAIGFWLGRKLIRNRKQLRTGGQPPPVVPDISIIREDTEIIEKYVWYITKSKIQNNLIHDKNILLEKALDYYKVNDNEKLVFEIVCNGLDVPNIKIIQEAKCIIDNLNKNSAFWITGEGGTGKTSLLIRLAVEYALQDKPVFFINFENPNFKYEKTPELLNYIKEKTANQKAFIFIDNPAFDQDSLEFLLRDIINYGFEFIVVFTERTIRLDLMKKENIQHLIYSQKPIEPLKIVNSRSYREKVYKKFYELIGQRGEDIWQIIQDIGVKPNLAFVNSTYRILYELGQKKIYSLRL